MSDLALDLNGSSCLSRSESNTLAMAYFVFDDRCEVERDSDVDVSRGSCIFLLKNNLGLVKLKFCALMSSGSGSGTVEPELILRRP